MKFSFSNNLDQSHHSRGTLFIRVLHASPFSDMDSPYASKVLFQINMRFSRKKRSCLYGQEHGYGANLPRTNGHIAKIKNYITHFLAILVLILPYETAE